MRRKQTRNAGRKRKADEMHLTVKDVREMMSVKRPEEIYHTLGISKATYYRRVAQMREKSDNGRVMHMSFATKSPGTFHVRKYMLKYYGMRYIISICNLTTA